MEVEAALVGEWRRREGSVWIILVSSLPCMWIHSSWICREQFFVYLNTGYIRVFPEPYFLVILSAVKGNFVSPRSTKKYTNPLIISLSHNTSKWEKKIPTADFSLLLHPYFRVENLSPPISRYRLQLKKVPAHSRPISIPRDSPPDQLECSNVTDHDGLPSATSTM